MQKKVEGGREYRGNCEADPGRSLLAAMFENIDVSAAIRNNKQRDCQYPCHAHNYGACVEEVAITYLHKKQGRNPEVNGEGDEVSVCFSTPDLRFCHCYDQ